VNSKSVLSTKVSETGSDVPAEPEDLFEMAQLIELRAAQNGRRLMFGGDGFGG
jgi:hypothetical protein